MTNHVNSLHNMFATFLKTTTTVKSINVKTTKLYNHRNTPSTNKDSGITNYANLYATQTMNNTKYLIELPLRAFTGNVATNKILARLPLLNI